MPESEEPSLDEVRAAVDALDPLDEDWIDLQWHVADALHDRYLETLDPAELTEAIDRGARVVRVQGEGSPEHLLDVSLMLWTRIEADPTTRDVNEYVRLNERALALCAADPSKVQLLSMCQANLATGLMSRNRFEPSSGDRNRAIGLWEAALEWRGLDEDVRAGIHANIAQALSSAAGSVTELRTAVEHGHRALTFGTQGDEDGAQLHFSLANALTSLSERTDESGLVQEAIEHIRRGLDQLGSGHPDYGGYCVNLVTALRSQARETGDSVYLDEAEDIVRGVILPRIPAGHHDRVFALTMSAAIVSELAYWRDADSMHREAISLYAEAIESAPPDSHEQGIALVNLASTSRDASERLNDTGLIDSGIDAGKRALTSFDARGPHRAAALTATSNLLRDRFVARGQIRDLDKALELAEDALDQTPREHQEFAARLTNLAVLLSDDYAERANRTQLDRAISLYREALAYGEPVARRVTERQSDLALALRDRHKDTSSVSDLDEAIDHAAESVDATPEQSIAWAGYANNYANALAERFEINGNLEDLEQAIRIFREVQKKALNRPTEASGYATNLGLALATLAVHTRRDHDFDEAFEHLTRAVALLPEDHPDLATRVSNLADVHRQRSEALLRRGTRAAALRHARTAVETAERAVTLAGSNEPRLLPALANQARAMRWLRTLDPALVSVEEVLRVQRRAALLSEVSPAERFGQSALWAQDAHQAGDRGQEMSACRQAVGLTNEVAWIGLTVGERLQLLVMMSDVLVAGVSLAIEVGEVWTALAWADQVRAVLAKQNILSKSLTGQDLPDDESMIGSLISSPISPPDDRGSRLKAREGRRDVAHRYAAQLHVQAPDPNAYRSLRFPGLVVLLVPGDEASSALVIDGATGADRVVALPLASRAHLAEQVRAFRSASAMFHEVGEGAALDHETRARHRVFDCLTWLWTAVAEPVLRDLPATGTRARVWWSPVGDFAMLPVHAAGVHPRKTAGWPLTRSANGSRQSVADRVVSSYLPTILPLARGGGNAYADDPSSAEAMLYVGVDRPKGSLPQVTTELSAIHGALSRITVDELIDDAATLDSIRDGIRSHSFLHVAAHGAAPDSGSLSAGFRLARGVFTLSDLAECDAGGRLAVFLTCDAAAGDIQSPNEALHLAGAAQQAGYSDVIAATMPLRDAPTVSAVGPLYRAVNSDPQGICGRVAEVLSAAVDNMRLSADNGPDPLAWAPYAHFGWGLEPPAWEVLRPRAHEAVAWHESDLAGTLDNQADRPRRPE